jgi:substrate import-associated zinc metallohydrolase lipoprotein
MNTKYRKILLFLFSFSILSGCTKEDDNLDTPLVGLGGETWVKGPLDDWLTQNFVDPYNIEVKYRMDRFELALNKALSPVREDKVIPVMETIKKTWIEPYVTIAGEAFIKKLSPKQFVLVGSPQYNTNGTITLGTAEGGRKVVLYVVNDFDKQQKATVKQMLHTIHHEFAHILHQTIKYPVEYTAITPQGYTSTWANYTDAQANAEGFITSYSKASANEDFVEMVALMLIEGRTGFNAMINGIVLPNPADPTQPLPNTTAQAALRAKEQLVVRYFKEAWNIVVLVGKLEGCKVRKW